MTEPDSNTAEQRTQPMESVLLTGIHVMDAYRAVTYWPDLGGDTTKPLVAPHVTLAAAEEHGMYMGCLSGSIRVEIYAPDGHLEAFWDKNAEGLASDGQ